MKTILLSLILFVRGTLSWAIDAGSFATKDFQNIMQFASQLHHYENPSETLVVFDIDNTLLRLPNDFGSEQWFLWQSELLKRNTQTLPLVTDSIEHLLQAQSWIYYQNPMSIVDWKEKQWIEHLQRVGAAVITLTSRSLNVKEATLRELHRNQIPLTSARALGLQVQSKAYLPYELNRLAESGLTPQDVTEFKLGPASYVSFDLGAFITQGQNKGIMLKTLIHRMNRQFKSIIFIDDRLTHIESMRKMASRISEKVYSIHFNYSENWTQPFLFGDKSKVEKQWCDFIEQFYRSQPKYPDLRFYRRCEKV